MNRQILIIVLLLITAYLCSCAAYVATPIIGGLVTSVTAPITFDSGTLNSNIQILEEVEGTATATSLLGIIATGDASVRTAYQNALSAIPDCDDLIDVSVDYKGSSFLGLFASYTTIVRGKAIRHGQPVPVPDPGTESEK